MTRNVGTPRYVLLDENRRLGPKVVPVDLGTECSVIYGFSDKACYDRFCRNSDLALRPYPLVERYLRSQIDDSRRDLNLIVLDAEGPRELCLHAATMEAVLQAQQNPTAQLTTTYQMVLDQQINAYRLEAAPCDVNLLDTRRQIVSERKVAHELGPDRTPLEASK